MNIRVLFVDNNVRFVKTRSEFLVDLGYEVVPAYTIEQAVQILKDEWVHVAIVDLRMVDDNDDEDISGLLLAKEETFSHVPKIILTGYPTFELVREALDPELDGLPPAVDFIAKKEGPSILIQAVKRAFLKYVRINQELSIQTSEHAPLHFPYLVNLIDPTAKNTLLIDRSNELEDTFRRLFYDKNVIYLDHLLWQRGGRVGLVVNTFNGDTIPKSFVVICGHRENVSREAQEYKEHAPKALSDTGTVLSAHTRTTHFAANAYALANVNLANVSSLRNLYSVGPSKLFRETLDTLVTKTLNEWHQGKRVIEDEQSLSDLYRNNLGLAVARMTYSAFEARITAILKQTPTLGVNIDLKDGQLSIGFNWKTYTYPDPTPLLFKRLDASRSVVLANTPGTLSGENILTDSRGRAWLTDFAEAGLAPVLWNCTALEAMIRFDWDDIGDLKHLHDMEHCFAVSRFIRPDLDLVEQVMRKQLRAIQSIRKLALSAAGQNEAFYHIGIFFQAASRIAAYDPDHPCVGKELARLTHVLIAMASLSKKIGQEYQAEVNILPEENDLRVDEQDIVWIRGMRLSIRGRSLDLLKYLCNHPDQVCKRADIAKHVFGIQDYDNLPPATMKTERDRMNAAIHRLRKKIEDDPSDPRYLLTEVGVGYRLVNIIKA